MCRPIEGNVVLWRATRTLRPRAGSSDSILARRRIFLPPKAQGIAHGQARNFRDYFLIDFALEEGQTLRAVVHHTEIKGVELTA